MPLIPSGARERHGYIDRSLEVTIDVLKAPETVALLGDLAISRAIYIENNYSVADIRHGKVRLDNITESQIPIVAAEGDEVVTFDAKFQEQTPIQEKTMKRILAGSGDPESQVIRDIAAKLKPGLRDGTLTIGTANAMVASLSDTFDLSQLARSGDPLLFHVHARPMIVLKYRKDAYRVNPSTIIHENEHVIQVQRQPIYEAPANGDWSDIRLREELAAFHIQALALKAMQLMGYKPRREYIPVREVTESGEYISDIFTIDQIRQRVNADRDDKFYPSQELKTQLAKAGLARIYQSTTGGGIS